MLNFFSIHHAQIHCNHCSIPCYSYHIDRSVINVINLLLFFGNFLIFAISSPKVELHWLGKLYIATLEVSDESTHALCYSLLRLCNKCTQPIKIYSDANKYSFVTFDTSAEIKQLYNISLCHVLPENYLKVP